MKKFPVKNKSPRRPRKKVSSLELTTNYKNALHADFSDALVDWSPPEPTGYQEEWSKYDTTEALGDLMTRDFPDHLWIEPNQWEEVARANDDPKYAMWPEDWSYRFTNQGNSHECTCHALIQCFEIAWSRQIQSLEHKYAIWFSPLSVYAEANPRRWGGSYMQRTLGIALQRGILPEWNGPAGTGEQKSRFAHTLNQTAGRSDPWVSLSRFPTGWKSTARHFRPLEVVNVSSWEEHVCLVLNGYCVANGRSGHAIPHTKIVWRGGKLYSMYKDSYDVHRFDSVRAIKSGVGGAYSIITTTVPDDWNKPAG